MIEDFPETFSSFLQQASQATMQLFNLETILFDCFSPLIISAYDCPWEHEEKRQEGRSNECLDSLECLKKEEDSEDVWMSFNAQEGTRKLWNKNEFLKCLLVSFSLSLSLSPAETFIVVQLEAPRGNRKVPAMKFEYFSTNEAHLKRIKLIKTPQCHNESCNYLTRKTFLSTDKQAKEGNLD
jgi:hypothetical protein